MAPFNPNDFKVDDCRVCNDINQWAKKAQKVAIQELKEKEKKSENAATECPPDALELGRATWAFLHTMSVYYPNNPSQSQKKDMLQFINIFSKFYPCGYCAEHLQTEMKRNPPSIESRQELAQWFCRIHNEVNERLGKPVFDCSKVFERWKTGPPDGSCG